MSLPVEYMGNEKQRIPADLVAIDKDVGLIRYTSSSASVRIPLSELQLAPSALEESDPIWPDIMHPSNPILQLSPRDPVEVWLSNNVTLLKKPSEESDKEELGATGAWWPGHLISVQGGYAHVEVAAPLVENSASDDLSGGHVLPHSIRVVPSILPYRSTVVKLEEVRTPWNGKPQIKQPHINGDSPNQGIESNSLASPGVLHRHTLCIPAYLARLATSMESHCSLLKFCGSPCLVQCDPEPFLTSSIAKRIVESDLTIGSGRHTPNNDIELEANSTSVSASIDSHSPGSTLWPSASIIAHCAILNPPCIAGTLSPAGVTDPTLLLEGLPGFNGPLVMLHIWSGSSEAIRRAALLELAHIRILVFRYHVMRKMSTGESGDLDFADTADSTTDTGDTPVLHCKPISIPVTVPADGRLRIGYSAQFRIQPRLIGLVIGYRGSTIQEARSLPGVRAVDLFHNGNIYVEAESVAACHAVRDMLDFIEAEIPVSPRLASRLIGSKGMNIRKLAASAGVRKTLLLDPLMRKRRQERQQNLSSLPSEPDLLEVNDDSCGINGKVAECDEANETASGGNDSVKDSDLLPPAFYILGTRESVSKMRLLLDFQADNWHELDELEEARRSLFSQLRMSSQTTSNFFPTDGAMRGNLFGSRGRGRRASGLGGSADLNKEKESGSFVNNPLPARQRNRGPPYNGVTSGKAPNQSGPSKQSPDNVSSEVHSNDAGTQNNSESNKHTDVKNGHEGTEGHDSVNGWRRPSGPRGRGRNRVRN